MAGSFDAFLAQLSDSGLMSEPEVRAFLEGIPEEQRPSTGQDLAQELVRRKRLTRFQAEELAQGNGRRLVRGDYVLLDTLGQGGMGVVYRARHRLMKRTVALKVLPPELTRDPGTIQRFLREVEAAARLSHPNIVAAYDARETEGGYDLILEYVPGRDLSAVVKQQGPLRVAQAIDFILQAARGLEYAHQQGVIHRDIKPSNLLVDQSGTVKILDMGLARLQRTSDVAAHAELTGTGVVMGTVDYMSPEQARESKQADARSDVYSLGMSLYYLLTGRPAYAGESLTERLLAHQSQAIPSLCAVRADVPAALDTVFRKMVAKSPEDRYRSMTEVISALQSFRQPDASVATGVSAGEDGQFLAFLANLGQADAGTHAASRQTVATVPQVTESPAREFEPTITLAQSDAGTDPQTHVSLAVPAPTAAGTVGDRRASRAGVKPRRTSWWRDRRAQLGGVVFVALLVIGISLWKPGPRSATPSVPRSSAAPKSQVAAHETPTQKHREAAQWVLSVGGSLEVTIGDVTRSLFRKDPLPDPEVEFRVKRIDLGRVRTIRPEDLSRLAHIEGAFYLQPPHGLAETDVARVLAGVSGIETLNLSNADPTFSPDVGEQLGANGLSYLILTDRQMRVGSIAALRRLPGLRNLLLWRCKVTPAVVAEASQLPGLQALNLEGSSVTDEHLAALTMSHPLQLALFGTPVTARGVADFLKRHPGSTVGGIDHLQQELRAIMSEK